MGFYLNPGNKVFWESIRSKIYVDKTELIVCIIGEFENAMSVGGLGKCYACFESFRKAS